MIDVLLNNLVALASYGLCLVVAFWLGWKSWHRRKDDEE